MDFDFTLGPLGRFVHHGLMPMVVADLPIGFLFVLAISSLGVYGVALAGWSSNSKYSLLGGLRACAQMISYEVAMGLSLIPVLLMSGNVSFSAIVSQQQSGLWYVLPLFLSFFIFFIAGLAETNRLPFDLPEAESELIAGYHTEYSAMKFSFFFIAEYANVVTVCAMVTTLFFGGWDIPRRVGRAGRGAPVDRHGRVLLPEGDVLDLRGDVDPLDVAPLPVRSAHGPRAGRCSCRSGWSTSWSCPGRSMSSSAWRALPVPASRRSCSSG